MTSTPATSAETTSSGWWLALPVLAMLLSRALLMGITPLGSDADFYCEWALKTVDLGRTPYRDVPIEYPPLAYRVLTVPRLWPSERVWAWTMNRETWNRVLPEYLRDFRRMMAVCDAVAFVLIVLTALRRRPELAVGVAWGYVLATLLLPHLLHERLDAGLLLLVSAWAYAWVRAMDSDGVRAHVWRTIAYAALGLSVAYKIMPVVVVPLLLASELRAMRRWNDARGLIEAVAALSLTALGPFAYEYHHAGSSVWALFQYHGERGIQLESTYASGLMLLKPLGTWMMVVSSHGAQDLQSAWTSVLAEWSIVLSVTLVGGTTLWMLLPWCRGDRATAYRLALGSLAATLVVSKVLSPQFFIWGLPVILLWGADVLERAKFYTLIALTLLLAGLTTLIYPYFYFTWLGWAGPPRNIALAELHPIACALLIARNALLIGVVAWLGVRTVRASYVRGG